MAMTENECLEIVKDQIAEWRILKYNYAANLMQYFIDKKGTKDYQPTKDDIKEVQIHARPKIRELIGECVNREERIAAVKAWLPGGVRPELLKVKIYHPGKGSTDSSNIRWWYIGSNKNMLNAFGGADLNVNGFASVDRSAFHRTWTGSFKVSIGDLYTFDSNWLKSQISAFWSDAYEAALKLELEFEGYTPFYHRAITRFNFVNTLSA